MAEPVASERATAIFKISGTLVILCHIATRARIFKRLRSPVIDSEESIPPAYVAVGQYDK
jgi:hypothetical protein